MALLDFFKRRSPGRRNKEPSRDTAVFPNLTQGATQFYQSKKRAAWKPTPRNLRYFAKTVYARRAINAIKNPIAMLEWEIVPIPGVEMNAELEKQAEIVTYCFEHPNFDDNSRSLLEAIVEDLMLGAGAVEHQLSGDPLRPLWLWPVDALTIQIFPLWDGAPGEARYMQVVGYGNYLGYGAGSQILLRNDELIYIRPNPSSATPFGLGPVEVAFNSISRILGVGEFAGNVAMNARPSILLDLGSTPDATALSAFRYYWRNEVEGQGIMPITAMGGGGTDKAKERGPEVIRLYPEGDTGLYLKYQEFMKSEIAAAFDLSPMALGVERDINRNTAEVGEDRDRDQAQKPIANLIETHFTREAIQAKLGFSQLMFRFKGLDNEDELEVATVYEKEFKSNAITPNEYREQRGREPMDSEWGDLTFADIEIAMQAARGAGQVDDPALTKGKSPTKTPKRKKDKI